MFKTFKMVGHAGMLHHPLAALIRDAESAELKYLFVCREMTANKKLAAFGKKDDHLFTPAGMSGFVQSGSPDWTKNITLCALRASVVRQIIQLSVLSVSAVRKHLIKRNTHGQIL